MSGGKRWMWILAGVGLLLIGMRVFGGSGTDDGGNGTSETTTTQAAVAVSTTTTSKPAVTTTTAAVTRRSLLDAVQRGLVEVEFRALGGASGDVAELDIRSLVDADLEITVPAGLMLQNSAGGEQEVVAGLEGFMTGSSTYEPAEVIRLDDDSLWTYLLKAYCAEAHDANPSEGGALTMGPVAGPDLVAVLTAVDAEGVGENTVLVQAVVWVVTDDVSVDDLESAGYGLEAGELAQARAVIAVAGLDPRAYRLFAG
jgi:hypothetical protein